MADFMTAHREWASRPADERFLDLDSLLENAEARQRISREIQAMPLHRLNVEWSDKTDALAVRTPSGMTMGLNNWSFRQLCAQTGAPAKWLRKLPARLAAANLDHGLRQVDPENTTKVLFANSDGYTARAFNGVDYGRIYDAQVIAAVRDMNERENNRWTVPLDAYGGINSIEATTLYGSDRDCFGFLVDQQRPIEVDGQTLFRGFYFWNSEVGSVSFGIATFLFSYVCQNRMIWGGKQFEELRMRHTAYAPDRFLDEARPVLAAMAGASDEPIISGVRKAMNTRIGNTVESVTSWLRQRSFTTKEAHTAIHFALEGGSSGSNADLSLWSVVQGGTASARTIENTNDRTATERRWSHLLTVAGMDVGTMPEDALAEMPSAN